MGNSIEQKSSLLVKNWVKLDGKTYRNAITEELIDQYSMEYQTEEEMLANHTQLMIRANINHPNIIKLIYFCQNQKGCCSDKVYKHRVFIEHQNQQLSEYLASFKEKSISECICCSVANAFNHLSQKYGYFRVKDTMIFLGSQAKWHKSQEKKIVKTWINTNLSLNKAENYCKQEEMCQSLFKIYENMAKHGFCSKIKTLPINQIFKMQQLLQQVYKAHNNSYQKQSDSRRRVSSTYSLINHNTQKGTQIGHQSSQDTLVIKNNRAVSNYLEPDPTLRHLNRVLESERKNDEVQTTKKLPASTAKKLVSAENMERPSPFYKPPNKVSFAYNDLFSTPKQSKSIQQEKVLNISSPTFITNEQPSLKPIQREVVNSKQEIVKTPKIERLTVNIMVESQPERYLTQEQIALNQSNTPSEQIRKKKLQQILQSSGHIASSPFLIDVNQHDQQFRSYEIMEQSAPSLNLALQNDKSSSAAPNQEAKIETQSKNYVYESDNHQIHQIHVEVVKNSEQRFFADPSKIPICESIRDSIKTDHANDSLSNDKENPNQQLTAMELELAYQGDNSQEMDDPFLKFGTKAGPPPMLMHTSKYDTQNRKSRDQKEQFTSNYQLSVSNSQYSKLDSNYNKYLQKFNQVINPISPRSKFNSRPTPFESLPSHSSQANRQIPEPPTYKQYNKYSSLNLDESLNRKKSKSKPSQMEMSDGRKPREVQSGEIQSLYNQSSRSSEQNKAKIIERIENTEKIIRENRKKLQKLQLEKDLQREKEIIKKEMQSLLKNNLMSDESNRIKEKVKYKKATFAQLKAEASKILEDINF